MRPSNATQGMSAASHLGPHDVGQRLRDRQPRHGCRIEQALHRLLSARGSDTRGREVARRYNPAVSEGGVQGSDALLLGDKPCYRAIDLS